MCLREGVLVGAKGVISVDPVEARGGVGWIRSRCRARKLNLHFILSREYLARDEKRRAIKIERFYFVSAHPNNCGDGGGG